MKKIILLLIMIVPMLATCQTRTTSDTLRARYIIPLKVKEIEVRGQLKLTDTLIFSDGSKMNKAAGDLAFNGNRTVTRSGVAQVNAGGVTVVEFLNNYFFPSTSPTASISISVSTSQEYMAAGTALTVNLPWSVTRPVACTPIASITVNGTAQTPSGIAEGQSQNGTLTNQSLTRNTNQSYTINVVSQDGKTGSSSVSVNWYWRRYWGAFSSVVPPTNAAFVISDAQIIALTGAGIGTGSELATSRTRTYNGINGAGNYLVFAFPSTWGTPVFRINGLTSTAFTKVRDNTFVNAAGGSTSYQVWVSNTTMTSAIANFEIQ